VTAPRRRWHRLDGTPNKAFCAAAKHGNGHRFRRDLDRGVGGGLASQC
jgi:hypothetical protein